MCDAWTTELAALKRWDTHWTHDEITRREHDHARWHNCDDPWTPTPGLPRDPEETRAFRVPDGLPRERTP